MLAGAGSELHTIHYGVLGAFGLRHTDGRPDPVLGSNESLVVIATDGVGFDFASELLSDAPAIGPLLATFPSTSVPAWATSVTGLAPSEHGFVGVVFFSPKLGRLYNALSDSVFNGDAFLRRVEPLGVDSASMTFFGELARAGVVCLAIPGDLKSVRGPWTDFVLNGARVIDDDTDWARLRRSPEQMATWCVRSVNQSLQGRDRPLLVWVHVNIDEYIHDHGYDDRVARALLHIARAAESWADGGTAVLMHSDHGQARTMPLTAEQQRRWDSLTSPRYCRLPAGGAGRALWLHPRRDQADFLEDALSDVLGEDAYVARREALRRCGLVGEATSGISEWGELFVLARSERFPAYRSRPFEHGSTTPPEMAAVAAAWPVR